MDKSKMKKGLFSSVKATVIMAMFIALSIVFGKFLAIDISTWIRISFENLTVILSGLMFGPLGGVVVGAAADLLGCVLKGFPIVPLITVAAGANGLMAGILRYVIKGRTYPKLLAVELITHAVGSVLLKSIALHMAYGIPWQPLILWRTLTYIFIAAAEAFLIYILYQKKVVYRVMQ